MCILSFLYKISPNTNQTYFFVIFHSKLIHPPPFPIADLLVHIVPPGDCAEEDLVILVEWEGMPFKAFDPPFLPLPPVFKSPFFFWETSLAIFYVDLRWKKQNNYGKKSDFAKNVNIKYIFLVKVQTDSCFLSYILVKLIVLLTSLMYCVTYVESE